MEYFLLTAAGTGFHRLKWAGHVARMEEGRSAFKILAGKPLGKISLGRPRRRQY
jgi:hypothetical protein